MFVSIAFIDQSTLCCLFTMPSLLTLPRKLRHMIYDACLVSKEPIDFRRLASKKGDRLLQGLLLQPNLLAVCRQIYEEASSKLYGDNTFYTTIVPSWTMSGPVPGALGPQNACLVCQRDCTTRSLEEAATPAWNPRCQDIRRLKIIVQPYSYLDWRYRVPDPCHVDSLLCQHGVHASLPSELRPSWLHIHVAQGAVFPYQDAVHASNWYAVSRDTEATTHSVGSGLQSKTYAGPLT